MLYLYHDYKERLFILIRNIIYTLNPVTPDSWYFQSIIPYHSNPIHHPFISIIPSIYPAQSQSHHIPYHPNHSIQIQKHSNPQKTCPAREKYQQEVSSIPHQSEILPATRVFIPFVRPFVYCVRWFREMIPWGYCVRLLRGFIPFRNVGLLV